MTGLLERRWLRRLIADLALWATIGVVMAILGPFGSSERTLFERLVYWQVCMVGGGFMGVAIDEFVVRPRVRHFWARAIASSVGMTPFVTVLVGITNHIVGPTALTLRNVTEPTFQVFVVCFATMVLRQLAWAEPVRVEVAVASEPAPDPTAAFRQRLSAKRRAAVLWAVQAEDHYLRVHTDAGDELITAKFGDALAELAGAAGFQTHRSWWVAADAIDEVTWLRGRGEAKLKCGLTVPISRSNSAALREAGWF